MKKLITVVLILAMLLPAAALAEVEEWLYADTWTCTEYLNDGGVTLTTICLMEDGTAFCIVHMFFQDHEGYGRTHIGTWEVTGPDTINVVSGDNTSMDLAYATYNMMYNVKTRKMFFRSCMRDGDHIP